MLAYRFISNMSYLFYYLFYVNCLVLFASLQSWNVLVLVQPCKALYYTNFWKLLYK